MPLQVDIVEDESTGKRTIKTTSICWGNKLSLLVSTPFYDPRLPPNSKDPDLDFSQSQIEVNTEADWVKVSSCSTKPSTISAPTGRTTRATHELLSSCTMHSSEYSAQHNPCHLHSTTVLHKLIS